MRILLLSLAVAGAVGTIAGAAAPASIQVGQAQSGTPAGGGAATTGTGLLMGQVIDATTGKPVSDAVVALSGGGARGPAAGMRSAQPMPRVIVDSQGRFLFRDLPAGSFTLVATKMGYFGGNAGQLSPTGPSRPVDLGDDERLGDIMLRLWPYSSLSGTVSDDANAPLPGMSVDLLRRTAANGLWQLVNTGSALTDDRGAYRFGKVTPGTYVIEAHASEAQGEQLMMSLMLRDESTLMKMLPKLAARGDEAPQSDSSARVFPPMFYPSAAVSAQAMPIALGSGEERSGVDLRLKSAPARTVAGVVMDVDRSSMSVSLRLVPADSAAATASLNSPRTAVGQGGRFVFTGVPPGQYVIEAVSQRFATPPGARGAPTPGAIPLAQPAPAEPTLCATEPVTVADRDISDLSVTLHAGPRASGRVVFDGTGEQPLPETWPQVSVSLDLTGRVGPAPMTQGRLEADGTFRTASVAPGRYLLRVGSLVVRSAGSAAAGRGQAPTTWRARSAMSGSIDLLDQPTDVDAGDIDSIVLTLTDKPPASLSGTVRDETGGPSSTALLLVFPADPQLWAGLGSTSRRVKQARTTRDGSYLMPGLPAGEYFVAVGTDETFTDWQAPGALETLARQATRVQLTEGQSRTLDLKSGGR